MAWTNPLPSQGADPPWGTALDAAIQETRDRVEAIEAAMNNVAGVTSIDAGGQTLTGAVDLDSLFASIVHFHSGADLTSGTVSIVRLNTGVPIVVLKAKGGFGASAGNWPASRSAITTDANRCILYIGNSDPGASLMNDDVDQWIITT